MRILHVSQPVDGGVAIVVSALVADEVQRGNEVFVASPDGQLASATVAAGANWRQWRSKRKPDLSVVAETKALSDLIRAVEPELLILHSSKAGLAGRLAARGRIPTVFVPHAWSFQAVGGQAQRLAKIWEHFAARWAQLIVCMCDDEMKRGEHVAGLCKFTVIRNGVDLTRFTPQEARQARVTAGMPDVPTVICVGRLAPQKGQDILFRAWPSVRTTIPNAVLILVGDGPARNHLETEAPAGVYFAGAQQNVQDWFALADVVAVPSRWETMSLVALEAMACGRPVVAFSFDGAADCLGDVGAVVPIGDHDKFARELCIRLSTDQRPDREGLRARTRAVQTGDIRRTTEKWDELLGTLATRHTMSGR